MPKFKAKEHTSTFYLSEDFLQELDKLAELLGITRSVLVERALYGKEIGDYERATIKITKKVKKKIPFKKGKNKGARKYRKAVTYKQECLFTECVSGVFGV